MATTNPSLFGMLGDEAAMQRQLDEQKAMQFANMTQGQRLASMGYRAGAGLGRGVASLFGEDIVDPAVRQASQIRQLASQFDTTTPEGMMQFARAVKDINPNMASQAAQQAQAMMKTSSEISKNLRERAAADPFQKLTESGKYTPASLAKYRESGNVADLELAKDSKQGISELGKLIAERDALDPVKNAGEVQAYNAKIKKLTTGGGIGAEIAAGLSPLVGAMAKQQAEKAGAAGGTEVGKQSAQVQGKYTALSSIQDALDVVDRGIYAGGYGPMQEAMAKYGGGVVGNKNRLVNTEEFRALIGDVVIPRLQEFGGNDSVEELKYLRSVMAGETTLEATSIKRILNNADKKIKAGIKRLEAQQQAIGKGQQLPVGEMPTQSVPMRATKRFNPATGQIEVIGGQ